MITHIIFDFVQVLYHPETRQFEDLLINKVSEYDQQNITSVVLSNTSSQVLNQYRSKLIPPFKRVFSCRELSWQKSDPSTYHNLCNLMEAKPEETIFLDDKNWNVEAATKAGLNAFIFESTDSAIATMDKILNSQ